MDEVAGGASATAPQTHKIRLGSHGWEYNKHWPGGENISQVYPPGATIEVPQEVYQGIDETRQRGLNAIASGKLHAQATFDFTDVDDSETVEHSIPDLIARCEAHLKSQGKLTSAVVSYGSLASLMAAPGEGGTPSVPLSGPKSPTPPGGRASVVPGSDGAATQQGGE